MFFRTNGILSFVLHRVLGAVDTVRGGVRALHHHNPEQALNLCRK